MSDSSHADTIRYYLSDEFDDYSDAFAALDALLAENQQLREALREPLQPCGDFPSKLEWLAFWLDGMDVVLETTQKEPLGRDVQNDLRRWAREWRAAVGEK